MTKGVLRRSTVTRNKMIEVFTREMMSRISHKNSEDKISITLIEPLIEQQQPNNNN